MPSTFTGAERSERPMRYGRRREEILVGVTPPRYRQPMGVSMPPSLSPSSIAAFKQCPLAFKFSYVERLPEPPSPAASKGTLVHKALELLMLRAPAERTLDA